MKILAVRLSTDITFSPVTPTHIFAIVPLSRVSTKAGENRLAGFTLAFTTATIDEIAWTYDSVSFAVAAMAFFYFRSSNENAQDGLRNWICCLGTNLFCKETYPVLECVTVINLTEMNSFGYVEINCEWFCMFNSICFSFSTFMRGFAVLNRSGTLFFNPEIDSYFDSGVVLIFLGKRLLRVLWTGTFVFFIINLCRIHCIVITQ